MLQLEERSFELDIRCTCPRGQHTQNTLDRFHAVLQAAGSQMSLHPEQMRVWLSYQSIFLTGGSKHAC